MKPFEVGKTYSVRDGRTATILAIDVRGKEPIVGLVHNEDADVCFQWTVDGYHYADKMRSGVDLIPEKEEVTFWIVLYFDETKRWVPYFTQAEEPELDRSNKTLYKKKVTITLDE